jgi:nucleotide-binding universal stress UspA family protein
MAAASVRRNPVRTMYGTIVCGITETHEARAAAQLAAALAERLGLRLVLVHVSFGHGGKRAIDELASRLGGHVEARVVSGNRADGLASVAADEGADVIVLGSRTRGARGRQLCCALARELEAVTDVPVLIAPPATRERSGRRLALAELAPRG